MTKPDIVIEAVGHQVATLGHAVEAAALGGTVFYFGVPDDDSYPISMRTMLRNNLTLKSGVTLDRRRVLDAADAFAREHPDLLPQLPHPHLRRRRGAGGVRAGVPADPGPGQDRDRRDDARAGCRTPSPRRTAGLGRLGGGPDHHRSRGVRPGRVTTTSDSTCQHGYLDDADVALLLRRLEHVPIATAVRLPSADPAPIGRVLDAGADAVIIAMVESAEQAAAAVAATRYAPAGVRSFGPLRASLGHRPRRARGAGRACSR